MIRLNDWWETLCDYHDCTFCDIDGKCLGGLYQCPHIRERARAWLPATIQSYEDLKSQEPYGEEYYMDLAQLKRDVEKYRRLAE